MASSLKVHQVVDDLFRIDKLVDSDKTGELSKLRNGEIGLIWECV